MLVQLLGPLRATLDDTRINLAGPKQCGLFVRLVLANDEAVGFDTLMDDLWPGRDTVSARRNLQQQIHALRGLVGRGRIVTVGGCAYRLKLAANELDSVVADDALHSARSLAEVDPAAALSRVSEALTLFHGPPLTEFASHDWARSDAVRLTHLREDLKSLEIQLRLDNGNDTALIPELTVLTENHPENERYWAALMKALYRDGRQQEALNCFQDARRRLGQQFGLEPSPELYTLERQILSHESLLKAPPPAPASAVLSGCDCWIDRAGAPLVGRGPDLERIDQAVAGGARLVLVSGELGIGKTRLVMEFARRNPTRRVFYGAGDDSAGRSFPPIADIVEHVNVHNPGLLQRLEADASMDALHQLIGIEDTGARHTTSRSALLGALGTLLKHLSDDEPPVLVIDQLAQVDADTLEVLGRLIGPLATSPVLVIGIARTAELVPDAPLATWLNALPHQTHVAEVPVRPLEQAAVAELARSLGDDRLDDATLLRQSGGNPMFVEQLARTRDVEDTTSLARLAWRRVATCSPQAVTLLRAAAIDGLHPRGWLTIELASLSPDESVAALEEVIADGLLSALPDVDAVSARNGTNTSTGRYWFVHGLIRDVLLDQIGPEQRRTFHRRAAELLAERRSGGDLVPAGDIARHYLLAAPSFGRGPAIKWLRAAAASAVRNSAYDRASSKLASALALISDDADDDETAAELLIERGRVLSTYIHQGEGRILLDRAIERARRSGRTDLAAIAALEIGGVLAMGDVSDPSIADVLSAALQELGAENPHLRAELLARLAQLRYWDTPLAERTAICDEADRLAAGAGAAVRTRIGINRYWACDIDADTVVTWSLIERLGSLAAQSGEKMLALQVLKCRLHTTLEGGDLEAADDVAARFAASAAEVGSADMLRLDRLYAAMRAGSRGEYHLASELADESSRLLAETGRALHAQVVDGLVRLPWQTMVGDHRAAEMTIDVLRMFSERGSLWVIFDAWFHAVSGNLDAATAAADEFDLESFLGEERQQNHWILASTAVLVAQFTGRTQWAAPLAAWFGEQPEASVHFGQTMFLGFGWHYLGIAESMLEGAEHKEAAVQALATAANRSARVDATPWRLFAEVELARLGVGPDGRGDADPSAIAAEAEDRGLTLLAKGARSLA